MLTELSPVVIEPSACLYPTLRSIFLRTGAAMAGAINRKTKTEAADNNEMSRYESKEYKTEAVQDSTDEQGKRDGWQRCVFRTGGAVREEIGGNE